jgi:hypothetical protein
MEHLLDPFWIVLVLDKAKATITVAACDLSRETAEANARERESPDAPMISLNVTGNPDTFRNRLSLWLAENEIVGTENTETMRSIAASMKQMINSIDKQSKRKNRPLR